MRCSIMLVFLAALCVSPLQTAHANQVSDTAWAQIDSLLGGLRTGTHKYREGIRWLMRILGQNGLTLEQVGTSETELQHFRRIGAKAAARYWLNEMRQCYNKRCPHGFLEYEDLMRAELEVGNWSLENIGSDEDEIEELRELRYPPKEPDPLIIPQEKKKYREANF